MRALTLLGLMGLHVFTVLELLLSGLALSSAAPIAIAMPTCVVTISTFLACEYVVAIINLLSFLVSEQIGSKQILSHARFVE